MKWMESNTRYLPIGQVSLTLAIIAYALLLPQSLGWWVVSFLGYCIIGCVGISVGYHRLLTHKSFKTSRFWECVCTLVGVLAFTGSSIGWVGVHRDHHRYSDSPGDPHSPHEYGAKMLLADYAFTPDKWAIRDMITDRFHQSVHRYYFGLLAAWSALWFVASLLTGKPLLMHCVFIPAALSVWSSTMSNYMNHKWGYRPHKTRDQSRNNWLNAIFTFGEGWHNNHHAFPGAWKFGQRWWEVDMGSWFVRMIKR